MPLNIRDEDVNVLATRLATHKHISKTAAVKLALENELLREGVGAPFPEWLQQLQASVAARGTTGVEADKAFYDSLNDE